MYILRFLLFGDVVVVNAFSSATGVVAATIAAVAATVVVAAATAAADVAVNDADATVEGVATASAIHVVVNAYVTIVANVDAYVVAVVFFMLLLILMLVFITQNKMTLFSLYSTEWNMCILYLHIKFLA